MNESPWIWGEMKCVVSGGEEKSLLPRMRVKKVSTTATALRPQSMSDAQTTFQTKNRSKSM